MKEVAQANGWSMNKLSQRSEVSYNIVKAIYRNPYRQVTIDTLNRLAETMKVPATSLLEDVTREQAEAEIEKLKK